MERTVHNEIKDEKVMFVYRGLPAFYLIPDTGAMRQPVEGDVMALQLPFGLTLHPDHFRLQIISLLQLRRAQRWLMNIRQL